MTLKTICDVCEKIMELEGPNTTIDICKECFEKMKELEK